MAVNGKTRTYKTTKKDFEKFKKAALKFAQKFGLTDWEIHVFHEEWGNEDSRAYNRCNYTGRVASISLAPEWNTRPVSGEIERTAFHEIFEVLLAPLTTCAFGRFVTEDEIDEAIHYIVRTMENVMLGMMK